MGTEQTKDVCVYCTATDGVTRDHLIARGFFPLDKRHGIPIVPACRACNDRKARLEHYLSAVIPFGATHSTAAEVLATMVQPRLENNVKLARTLADGARHRFVSQDYGRSWETEMSLPLDGNALSELFHMIVRGLAYAEFRVLLPDADCIVLADFLKRIGGQFFDQLYAHQGNRTGLKDLGGGIFRYEGVQSWESPQLTVWRMSLCGVFVSGDPQATDERISVVHAITAPRRMPAASKLATLLRSASRPAA